MMMMWVAAGICACPSFLCCSVYDVRSMALVRLLHTDAPVTSLEVGLQVQTSASVADPRQPPSFIQCYRAGTNEYERRRGLMVTTESKSTLCLAWHVHVISIHA